MPHQNSVYDGTMNQTLDIQNKIKVTSVPAQNWYKIIPLSIQILVTSIYWPFLKFFLHYHVEGLENIKDMQDKTAIFASNHTSELDPILITLILRKVPGFLPIFYVSREKSFYKKSSWRQLIYGGLIFRMCGAYPVYVGQQDYEKALQNHISILENGSSVCVFPEGKRSPDGKVGEARGGIGYLTHRTKKPIVPVAISGIHSLTFKDFILRKRTLKIKVGKPIYAEELFEESVTSENIRNHHICRTAADKVMEEISKML